MAEKRKRIESHELRNQAFMAGALEFRAIGLMGYLTGEYDQEKVKHKTCHLCKERRATHYIWEANVGKLIGKDSCHVFMCGKCVVLALYSQRPYVGCAVCKSHWPVPSYSVKLANGKDSSLLCKDCHLNGGHREELLESIKNISPKIKLNKSM